MRGKRTLVLLRHAKSAWPQDTEDFDRPLNDRGERDAAAAGRWLGTHRPGIELVLCSSALRARRTWELAAGQIPAAPTVRYEPRLYAASGAQLLDVVRGAPSTVLTILLIAHNPGLEELVGQLTGEPTELKTAGIAALTADAHWSGLTRAGAAEFAKPRG
ncbi:histidine phosphatase family protein [Saccharopolyspora sp. HNM0983]|uniref:Histidine phosphatase family protein n=2 Tax=Saccharopolyspora montiporae TaxID=2781240 RepID=A0A929BCJ1_9PSEU|nr:histidine phosphatase family protein [Saccharopolyspora sp. HNM0983]MBE9375865.1 histidine phosphatase family protein [Saccharopolyspora sp. HNM0983]